jgi:K+-sensing histidine kinase KdpD
VKRIVEAHGGRVTVRSAPGQGSDFVVHLPAAGDEPIRDDAQSNTARPDAHAAGVRS